MTEKLYYADSHLFEFTATVLDCREHGDGYAIVLDRTAFFPEGGGQSGDTGYIGSVRIRDVQEINGEILHLSEEPAVPGARLECGLDAEQRRRRMQNHSGEHIFSGLVHSLYALNNVGFHMGEDCMTIDFDGELDREQLELAERLANEAVRDNLPVTARFPDSEELKRLEYRSKLELKEQVRIVSIEGIDCCACCAPHVNATGEIGVIKLLSAERHRGGVRIELICGMDALELFCRRQDGNRRISSLLSAKKEETAQAVERLLAERDRLKQRAAELETELARSMAEGLARREGNICLFVSCLSEAGRRELVNLLMERCDGLAAVFSGSDETGYEYIIGSRSIDLRAEAREINRLIDGRGGGRPEMISGRARASKATAQKAMECYHV